MYDGDKVFRKTYGTPMERGDCSSILAEIYLHIHMSEPII